MDKSTKTKVITTVSCLAISLIALYVFWFCLDISIGRRIVLIMLAVSWIASGVIKLYSLLKK